MLALLLACASPPPDIGRGEAPDSPPAAPLLRRLTADEYRASVASAFGAAVVVTETLEPDVEVNGLYAVGASVATVSASGVEHYESAALSIATQALADPATRAALVTCEPASRVDAACTAAVLAPIGRRLWRRALTPDELQRVVGAATTAATTLGRFDDGLTYGLVALLESPNFLYRAELGEPDPDAPGHRRYTSVEMASRLAFALWDAPPDDALLDEAESGALATPRGVAATVDRMIADERFRGGIQAFFGQMFSLDALDALNKDPTVYAHMNGEVGPSAREETLADIERVTIDEDASYLSLLLGRDTWLNPKLAAIYGVPAPSLTGFAATTLPSDGGRRGLLGQVSVLALAAHPTSTSPTRRGMFVREVLLCQQVPQPPANLNTSIPEPSADAVTMRDRLASHLEDPTCAACHAFTDPIGLGLENFDGLGSWRDTDGGELIDASGELDGVPFADAWELTFAIASHPDVGPCLTRTFWQYATGRPYDAESDGELVAWHAEGFAEAELRVRALVRDVVTAQSFRQVGEVAE